jgi:hypothetical protein
MHKPTYRRNAMFNAVKTGILLCTVLSFCQAQIKAVSSEQAKTDGVNWETRTIIAAGIGAPNLNVPQAAQRPGALRAAQMVALRNALEIAKGIFMNSTSTVEDFMSTSDVITTQVNGFIKGFQQKGKERYMSDGSVELTMEIPLDGIGGMTEMLLGRTISDQPQGTSDKGNLGKSDKVFSGLIINCLGLKLKPALSPKVLDEDGKEVYGSAYVSKEWAVKYGIAGYAKSVEAAAKLERAGKTPGEIKALKTSGKNNTDVVLSNDDAREVRAAAKKLKFLSECRVLFIVD